MISSKKFFAEYKNSEKLNIMRIKSGRADNMIRLATELPKAAGNSDIYMSMNPLTRVNHSVRRDQEHIARLKWLYVDLDYYNTVYKAYTKDQIMGLLELDYYDRIIPRPTYVVDSGRGLYLLWRIDENVKAHSRWIKMQMYLYNQLLDFGADRKIVTDSARVLRIPGSTNSKSGSCVTILEATDLKYSLTSLIRDYITGDQPSDKMISYAEHISKTLQIPLPDMQNRDAVKLYISTNKDAAYMFHQHKVGQQKIKYKKITYLRTEYSLARAKLNDLEQLIRIRDYDHGYREHILFLYRYWKLCISDDYAGSLQHVIALNNTLHNPLPEKEVVQATKSAEKYYAAGKIFRCSNSYVIQTLNITPAEMQYLQVFISPEERKNRKKARNQRAYLAYLKNAGKKTKKDQIRDRRIAIEKMIRKGYSVVKICETLHISRATLYSDLKIIQAIAGEKEEKKAKLQKLFEAYKSVEKKKSLIFSAPLLYMSFRTSSVVLCGYARVILYRYLRYLWVSFCSFSRRFGSLRFDRPPIGWYNDYITYFNNVRMVL